jgi:hypothetical protein
MPGITLEDIANEGAKDTLETLPVEHEAMYQEQTSGPSKAGEMFNRVLTAETGEGSINSYIDHPMNFSNSMGLAQLIRGLTGMIGNLNLAIVDVIFGALRFSKEKRGASNDGVRVLRGDNSIS